jgi:hypothetical protein
MLPITSQRVAMLTQMQNFYVLWFKRERMYKIESFLCFFMLYGVANSTARLLSFRVRVNVQICRITCMCSQKNTICRVRSRAHSFPLQSISPLALKGNRAKLQYSTTQEDNHKHFYLFFFGYGIRCINVTDIQAIE